MNEYFYQYTCLPRIKTHPDFFFLVNGIEEDFIFQLLQVQATTESCHPVPFQVKTNVIEQNNESHYIAMFPNQTKILFVEEQTSLCSKVFLYLINASLEQENNFSLKKNQSLIVSRCSQ